MKKFIATAKDVVKSTFAITSVVMLALLIFMSIAYTLGGTSIETPAITMSAALTCLLIAFLYSLCNLIFKVERISILSRTILHFFATLISIILVSLISDYEFRSASLVLIVMYAILYLLIVPIVLLVKSSLNRRSSQDKEFKSIFQQR